METASQIQAVTKKIKTVSQDSKTALYLMRRSLEILRKFHWMILGGRFNQLSHVSSLLLSKSELQAMDDQDEVHDILLAAKDAKRGEESKLTALNDVIDEALDEIKTQENNVEILEAGINDV
ncbi:hypothetical protein Tco_0484292 [Tanacetum coccineum]